MLDLQAPPLAPGPAIHAPRALRLGGTPANAALAAAHGPDGATATLDGGTEHRVPLERVEGLATGAGDAFAAGLLLGLTRGLRPGDALELGCRLGLSAARTRARAGTASAGS